MTQIILVEQPAVGAVQYAGHDVCLEDVGIEGGAAVAVMAQKRELQVSELQAFQRMIESWCVHLDRMCTEEAFLRTTRHTEELMNQTYTSADYLEYSLVYDVVLRRQRTNDGRERTSLRIQQMDGKTQLSQWNISKALSQIRHHT